MILRIRREFEESEWFQTVRTQNFWRHWPYGTHRNVSRRTAHYGRINRGRYSFQDHCIDDGHRLVWLASTGYAALLGSSTRDVLFNSLKLDLKRRSLQLSSTLWSLIQYVRFGKEQDFCKDGYHCFHNVEIGQAGWRLQLERKIVDSQFVI